LFCFYSFFPIYPISPIIGIRAYSDPTLFSQTQTTTGHILQQNHPPWTPLSVVNINQTQHNEQRKNPESNNHKKIPNTTHTQTIVPPPWSHHHHLSKPQIATVTTNKTIPKKNSTLSVKQSRSKQSTPLWVGSFSQHKQQSSLPHRPPVTPYPSSAGAAAYHHSPYCPSLVAAADSSSSICCKCHCHPSFLNLWSSCGTKPPQPPICAGNPQYPNSLFVSTPQQKPISTRTLNPIHVDENNPSHPIVQTSKVQKLKNNTAQPLANKKKRGHWPFQTLPHMIQNSFLLKSLDPLIPDPYY
jgi:hypothetical protein